MATIVIKSRLGGSVSFTEFEKTAGGELEIEESSTVFFLPRLVSSTEGSISNRVMTHLRSILEEEGVALDVDRTHIFRIGIDPMTAISKLAELGFYATNSCTESPAESGGSIMSWTMVHDSKTKPPAVNLNRSRVSNPVSVGGTTAEEEEEPVEEFEKADSEYVPSEHDDRDEDFKAGQKRGRGRPRKVPPAAYRQTVTVVQNGSAGRRVLQALSAAKAIPAKATPARAVNISKPSPASYKQAKREISQDEESYGSHEGNVGVDDARPVISDLSQIEVEQLKGYVTTTSERLGTEEAESLLMGKTKIDPVLEMPRKAPGGTVWLYTDQGEPWRSRDYMSDGYCMQQCSTRMWPAHQPVLCVIQYRVIVYDKQSNDFCRYVMMLPSALHATAAECQNMRNGRRPSERIPFLYLVHYVGDHSIAVDVDRGGRSRGPHRVLPSQMFFEHMQRGEKKKGAKTTPVAPTERNGNDDDMTSSQESDLTNGRESAVSTMDDDIQEIAGNSSIDEQ